MEVQLSYLTTKQEKWVRNLIPGFWWRLHRIW